VKNRKIENVKLYLYKHFEKMNDIKITMNSFHTKYPKINWLYDQHILYEGNDNFYTHKNFVLIGYDEDNVIIAYIKPQFNSLNYNEILVNSIFHTHLVTNVKKMKEDRISENYNKFYGK
jgi:hypothetical protein